MLGFQEMVSRLRERSVQRILERSSRGTFGPKVEGFDQVPLGDMVALKAAIGPHTAAILIEPVQGEGGIRVVAHAQLKAMREICDAHGLLLIFDEVQCGVGRLGKLFACEAAGVTPDIMAIAKGIGGGFPLGAFLTTKEAGKGMTAGTPFALAHTFAQTGPFRPANTVRGVDNAVLAGSSTVPGVGVPTTLISGRLAADRITGSPARATGTTTTLDLKARSR